jgi:hypothetical protein
MNHKVGIWIDQKKAVSVSASASGVTAKTLESEVDRTRLVLLHPRDDLFRAPVRDRVADGFHMRADPQ